MASFGCNDGLRALQAVWLANGSAMVIAGIGEALLGSRSMTQGLDHMLKTVHKGNSCATQAPYETNKAFTQVSAHLLELPPPSESTARLVSLVLEKVSIIGGDWSILLEQSLIEAGIDSLSALELRNQLSHSLEGLDLPATMLFEYPTVSQLAAYLQSRLFEIPDHQKSGKQKVR